MAACELLIVFLLSPLLTTIVTGTTTYRLNWTREGVSPYHINNPLVVKLGDIVALNCVNSSFRSVWLLTEASEYESCSCSTSCAVQRQRVTENCIPVLREVLLQINENALDLDRVFNYRPGRTYYVASFDVGEMGGGACLPTDSEPGVRMALMVSNKRAGPPIPGNTNDDDDDDDGGGGGGSIPTPKSSGIGDEVEGDTADNTSEDTNIPIIPLAAAAAGTVFLIIMCVVIIIIAGIACSSRRPRKKTDVYLTSAGNGTLNSNALYNTKPEILYNFDEKEEKEVDKKEKDFTTYSIGSLSTFKGRTSLHQDDPTMEIEREGDGGEKASDSKNKLQELYSSLHRSGTMSKPVRPSGPVEVNSPQFATVAPKFPARISKLSNATPLNESSALDPPNVPAKEPKPSLPPYMPAKDPKPSLPPNVPAKEPKPSLPPNVPAKEPKPSLPPNVSAKEPKPSLPPNVPAKEAKPSLPPNVLAKPSNASIPPNVLAKEPKPSLPSNVPAKEAKPSPPPNMLAKKPKSSLPPNMPAKEPEPSLPPNMPANDPKPSHPPNIPAKELKPSLPPNVPAKDTNPSLPPKKEPKPSLPPNVPSKEPKPSIPPNVPAKEAKPLLPPNMLAKEPKSSLPPNMPAKDPKPSLPPNMLAKEPKPSNASIPPTVPAKPTSATLPRSLASKESKLSSSHSNLSLSNAKATPPKVPSKPTSTSAPNAPAKESKPAVAPRTKVPITLRSISVPESHS